MTALSGTSQEDPARPDVGAQGGHRNLGLALLVISAAQLMVVLDATIVNIALPHIQSDLNFSTENLSWVVNGYTLAFGGLLLLGGRAGDLLGRRKVFVAGVLVFAAASLVGGFATSSQFLLAARVAQGVGAAIASPTALSLVTTTFPAGPPRNRAMAVYAAMSGAGAAIGLILGGALTEFSWRWTFFINVPIGVLVAVLAPNVLGESRPQPGRFDLGGALTGTLGLGLLVYGLTHAASNGWSDAVTVACLAVGLALLLAFASIESRSRHALMPIRILANRNRGGSYLVMLGVGAAMFASFYFLSLHVQGVMGYSSLRAGFAFLPFSVGIVVAAQVASRLVSRVAARWIAAAGGLLAAAGLLGYAQITPESTYARGLLPAMLTMSVGMGLLFVPLTLTAVNGVENADQGIASAVLNTMQQIGGALGLASLSTVATTAATSRGNELVAAIQARAGTGSLSSDAIPSAIEAAKLQAQVFGFTRAFLVGSAIVAVMVVVVVTLVVARHDELARAPRSAHLG